MVFQVGLDSHTPQRVDQHLPGFRGRDVAPAPPANVVLNVLIDVEANGVTILGTPAQQGLCLTRETVDLPEDILGIGEDPLLAGGQELTEFTGLSLQAFGHGLSAPRII